MIFAKINKNTLNYQDLLSGSYLNVEPSKNEVWWYYLVITSHVNLSDFTGIRAGSAPSVSLCRLSLSLNESGVSQTQGISPGVQWSLSEQLQVITQRSTNGHIPPLVDRSISVSLCVLLYMIQSIIESSPCSLFFVFSCNNKSAYCIFHSDNAM